MRHFLIGLQFLTRIHLATQYKWELEDFGKSVPTFTAVGVIIGLLSALVYYIFYGLLGPVLTALIVVVFHFLITGGLHADGFMDTCDGLFSGRERERKLEIMKDSRVGSNGVVGFVFLILLKWQLLAYFPLAFGIPFLILLSTISKQGLTMSVCLSPYARKEGMGKAFAMYAPKKSFIESLLILGATYIVLLLATPITYSFFFLIMIGTAIGVNRLLNSYIVSQLGGVTGDTYGFVSELTELYCLFIGACFLGLIQ